MKTANNVVKQGLQPLGDASEIQISTNLYVPNTGTVQ